MLGHKVFGAGLSDLAVKSITQDVGTGISAAGTTQGTATELTNAVNVVSTVASGSGVVLYSSMTTGDSQMIFNGGANPLLVYPPSGFGINSLNADTGIILATNTAIELTCVSTSQIIAILSA